jgi:hypothetical protein
VGFQARTLLLSAVVAVFRKVCDSFQKNMADSAKS